MERFEYFMDWLGRGIDILMGAIAWVLIVSALVAGSWLMVSYAVFIMRG